MQRVSCSVGPMRNQQSSMHTVRENPKKRANPIERTLARVFREAGARVRFNAVLRDMNVGVRADDDRRIEVLAQDFPCFGGSQVAVDVILRNVSASTVEGHPHAADVDGAIFV